MPFSVALKGGQAFRELLTPQNIYALDSYGSNVVTKIPVNNTAASSTATVTGAGNALAGVSADVRGNIFVSDYNNHVIWRVDRATSAVTMFAGNGSQGFTGDGGPATSAQLNNPTQSCFDRYGNFYFGDAGNQVIRKIDTAGIITKVAGTYGSQGPSGDGGAATSATLNFPWSVAVDLSGNIYIADSSNNKIRKVDRSGIISTFAGTGAATSTGDGGQATSATLSNPYGVDVDAFGNVYITDSVGHKIRKVNSSGVISTVAGTGTPSSTGDGGAATSATINNPYAVATDRKGNFYIGDTMNQRCRKVDVAGTISLLVTATGYPLAVKVA